MANDHSSTKSLLANLSSQAEPPTNWPEVWKKYVDDCANHGKQQGSKTDPACTNHEGNAEARDITKNRRRRRFKKLSVNPTEKSNKHLDWMHLWNLYTDFVQKSTTNCSESFDVDDGEANNVINPLECASQSANTAYVSNYNFLDSHWTKIWNLYKDFVYRPLAPKKIPRFLLRKVIPNKRLNLPDVKQNENHSSPVIPLQGHTEFDKTTSVSSAAAAESKTELNMENQQRKSAKKRPRYYSRKTARNEDQNRNVANSTAASSYAKQKPIHSPKNPLGSVKKEKVSQKPSNSSDATHYTSAGVNEKKRPRKGTQSKHVLEIEPEKYTAALSNTEERKRYHTNKHSQALRNIGVNHKIPTTSWNHLWNLYLDFVHEPIADCTSKINVSNHNIAVDIVASAIEKNDASMTNAENWSYLWDLYTDFVHNPIAESTKPATIRPKSQQLEFVAIDCEMVEVGGILRRRVLARVSIVDQQGKVLLDKFIKPCDIVTDYRTEFSGIRPQDIENGENFKPVRNKVAELIKGKIIVGHGLQHDLKVLQLKHPFHARRDTSIYRPLRRYAPNGRTPGLKRLCNVILDLEIQTGEHSSVEDAQAVMKLYNSLSSSWEGFLRRHPHGKKDQTMQVHKQKLIVI